MGANAATSVPGYVSGEVLTAARLNVTNSGAPVFADSSARDAAFGGTGEKTLAEGQLCYLEDSNVVQYYDGSSWATLGREGLVLVNTTAFSAVSSVSIDSCFTSSFDSYRVTLSNLTASSAGITELKFRLRVGGSDASGASDYALNYWRLYSTGTAANSGSTGTDFFSIGYASTGGKNSYTMDFIDPALAVPTGHAFQGSAYQSDIAAYINIMGAGTHKLSTAYDGFTFFTGTGTLTGTLRVYGYKNG